MSSVLIHNFSSRFDKNANPVSFESLDVGRQHLGYRASLLKYKIYLSDYKGLSKKFFVEFSSKISKA